jgi:hypothetical protein
VGGEIVHVTAGGSTKGQVPRGEESQWDAGGSHESRRKAASVYVAKGEVIIAGPCDG